MNRLPNRSPNRSLSESPDKSSNTSCRTHHKVRLTVITLLIGGFCLLPVSGVAAAGLDWKQLSKQERTVLKPFKNKWAKYPLRTKKTMRAWARLSSGERAKIKKRHVQWQALGAARKAKVIRKLERYKRMSIAKRLKLKAWRKWVKSLPKSEQDKLHKSLPGMSTKQRKEYIRQLKRKYGG